LQVCEIVAMPAQACPRRHEMWAVANKALGHISVRRVPQLEQGKKLKNSVLVLSELGRSQ
jgi:hypothetical protein